MDPFSYINREIFLLFALVFLIVLIDTALKRPGPFSRAGPGLRRNHADVVPSLSRGRVYQGQTVSRLLCRGFPDLQSRFRRNATNHCPGRIWRRPAAIEIIDKPTYFFLWPIISPRTLRESSLVRFFLMLDVSSEMCGISQRCSAINQTGFSVVIQLRWSKRARFTGRE